MLKISNPFHLYTRNTFNTQNKAQKSYSFSAPKLAPLQKDTVSFSSKYELDRIDNDDICAEIHEEAHTVQRRMEKAISSAFNGFIYDRESNPDGIIDPIDSRIKTPESIREKTLSKIQFAFEKNRMDKIFSPYEKPKIKENIKDISGTRIVMRNADDEGEQVLDTLCEMIEDNHFVVDEIENHSSNNPNIKPYFDEKQLAKLLLVVNKERELNGLAPIEITESRKDSGYMALHISFNTTSIGDLVKQRGYWHELQIIGADVGILKDVEDLCRKLEKGFEIVQGHDAYTPFEKFFNDAYPQPKDKSKEAQDLRDAYQQYTKKAYEIQRKKRIKRRAAQDDTSNWAYRYPTIKECGLEGKIPPILDFNILARIKRDCDDLYKISTHTQEILDGKEADIDNKTKIKFNPKKQTTTDSL